MKLKNEQVIKIVTALRHIESSKLPIGLAWKIQLALQTFDPVAHSYGLITATIRDKFALRDEKDNLVLAVDAEGKDIPGTFQVPIHLADEFQAEMDELGKQETNFVNDNFTLKVSEFPESFEISPVLLNYLTPILTH